MQLKPLPVIASYAILVLLSNLPVAAFGAPRDALGSIGRREISPQNLTAAGSSATSTISAQSEDVARRARQRLHEAALAFAAQAATRLPAALTGGALARLKHLIVARDVAVPHGLPLLQAPCTVLIAGDSMMQNGCLGSNLEAQLKLCDGVKVVRWAKESTGLSRLDFFDVPAKLAELLAQHNPSLVIVQWGANDCQSVTARSGKALAVFGTPAWDAEYGARVAALCKLAQDSGARIAFIGLPNMTKKGYVERIAHLNGVVQQAAEQAGALYISTWEITSTDAGAPLPRATFHGKQGSMRQRDGIHLSNLGAASVAEWVARQLEQQSGLTK